MLLIPLVEIALFIVIGRAIGLWPTLLGVLVAAVAGALVIRQQGRNLVGEIRATLGAGQLPARAVAETLMIGTAGMLLLIPGYFTDLVGILLLLPPVRAAIYLWAGRRVSVVTPGPAPPHRPDTQDKGPLLDLDEDAWRPR